MSWEAPTQDVSTASTTALPTSGGFAELGVPKALVSALHAGGITQPFPIQAATIPDALAGRDVLGRGQTGSGKTLGLRPADDHHAVRLERRPAGCARGAGAGADPRARACRSPTRWPRSARRPGSA